MDSLLSTNPVVTPSLPETAREMAMMRLERAFEEESFQVIPLRKVWRLLGNVPQQHKELLQLASYNTFADMSEESQISLAVAACESCGIPNPNCDMFGPGRLRELLAKAAGRTRLVIVGFEDEDAGLLTYKYLYSRPEKASVAYWREQLVQLREQLRAHGAIDAPKGRSEKNLRRHGAITTWV